MERIYCLKPNDFLLLAGIKGIKKLYCMELPLREEVDNRQLSLNLYKMVRNGLIFVSKENRFELEENLDRLFDGIKRAKYFWTYEEQKEMVRNVLYCSEELTVSVELSEEKEEFRIGEVEIENWSLPREDGTVLENDGDGMRIEHFNSEIQQEREYLLCKYQDGLKTDVYEQSGKEEEIQSVWSLHRMCDAECLHRIVFIQGTLFSWILLQNKSGTTIFFDSKEQRKRIIKEMFAGKEERRW